MREGRSGSKPSGSGGGGGTERKAGNRTGTSIRGHPGYLPAAGQMPLGVFLTPKNLQEIGFLFKARKPIQAQTTLSIEGDPKNCSKANSLCRGMHSVGQSGKNQVL